MESISVETEKSYTIKLTEKEINTLFVAMAITNQSTLEERRDLIYKSLKLVTSSFEFYEDIKKLISL